MSKEILLKLSKPHAGQKAVLECDKRFIVLMCGRRWGKSFISQDIAINDGVDGRLVAYVTPTYQLAKTFFDELVKILPDELVDCNKSDLIIKFITGGIIRFFTGERLDNFRGHKFHRVIVDEGSYIPNLMDGWMNSIRPTLTDFQGRAIFLSTPKGKNFFYSLYLKGQSEKDWASFRFTTYDNPYIPASEIDDAGVQLPEAVFRQEYLAEPSENADNPFGVQRIRDCISALSMNPPIVFGIDLAKSVDWTVIIGLDKQGKVCYFDRFQKDWTSTKQVIKSLPKAPMILDSTGVGDPITEELQNERLNVKGFKFTQGSKQNLMLGLSSAIHQKKLGYPEGPITNELEIFEYQYTATGVKYSAPQGFHDDCVMSLALAWSGFNEGVNSGQYSVDVL